jgi:Zn-dependent protease
VQFRIFRIPVYVSTVFWVMAALFGVLAHRGGWLVVSAVIVIFFAVLVHELGHALTARAFGAEPAIQLHALGGTTSYQGHGFSRTQGILTALAGPFAGFALGALCLLLGRIYPLEGEIWPYVLGQMEFCTFGWGIINLMPVLPLDGGHVLRDVLGPTRGRMTLIVSAVVGSGVTAAFLVAFERPNLFGAYLFGMAALQSIRHAWSYNELQEEERARAKAAADAAEGAARSLERGHLADAERHAVTALARSRDPLVRDAARRVLAAIGIERSDGRRALAAVSTLEKPLPEDDVLRAQALDVAGERELAFALLEQRATEQPGGPAVAPLLRGLVAMNRVEKAHALAMAWIEKAPVTVLSETGEALLEGGHVREAESLSRALFARTGDARYLQLLSRLPSSP